MAGDECLHFHVDFDLFKFHLYRISIQFENEVKNC